MRQFAGLIVAFLLLPVMLKCYPKVSGGKKAPLGPLLCLTGLIMAVIGGLSAGVMLDSLKRVFTTFSTLQTLIVVIEIGVLGSILKKYGILERIVHALEQLLPSKKALIMILPGIMGMLPVPGGAFLSAPFVDSIGTELGISGERKAVINLYFRHFAMFILPYNTTILTIGSVLDSINIYSLIGLNLGFVVFLLGGAWFFYIRTVPDSRSPRQGSRGQALLDVLKYLSPIYMAMVFNVVFGLQMYQAVFLCILLTFFLIGKDKSEYLKSAAQGFALDTVLMLVGVYFMQNVVKNLDVVMSGVGGMLVGDSILSFMLIVPLVGLAFGLTTGISMVPLGILLPFIAGMSLPPMTMTVYAFYILVWSFLGYYFSPFHLCQLLTIKVMECPSGEVYKQHLRMMPVLALSSMALFLLYRMIFI